MRLFAARASRPLLVLINMAVVLAISLLGIWEIREAIITVPGYSEWSMWTTCTKTCNSGIRQRKRQCNNPPPSLFGPRNCSHVGPAYEVAACNTRKCPIDGNFGLWSRFGKCSKTCGKGEQKRVRLCVNPPPQFGGKDCSSLGPYHEINLCNEQACEVNGGYSEWSAWTPCTKTCGPGEYSRERTCDNPLPQHGGKQCDSLGPNKEKKECFMRSCPVHGGYGDWAEWSDCSVSCGGGKRSRKRECNKPVPKDGGKDCSSLGSAVETVECGKNLCNVDGGYSEWSEWTKCSATCGESLKQRKRKCTNPVPSGNGKTCSHLGPSREILDCELPACAPK